MRADEIRGAGADAMANAAFVLEDPFAGRSVARGEALLRHCDHSDEARSRDEEHIPWCHVLPSFDNEGVGDARLSNASTISDIGCAATMYPDCRV